MNRRNFLVGSGSIATGALAGCSLPGTGSGGDGPGGPSSGGIGDWLVVGADPPDPDVTAMVVSISHRRQRELEGGQAGTRVNVPPETGIAADQVERVVFATDLASPMGPLSYAVYLGTFERDAVASAVVDDEGGRIETRGEYELLAAGEDSMAVTDDRLVVMNYPYGENREFPDEVGLVIDTASGDRESLLARDPISRAVAEHLNPSLFWQLELLDATTDSSRQPFTGLDAWGRSVDGTDEAWEETQVYHFASEADLEAAPIDQYAASIGGESAESVDYTVEATHVVFERSGEGEPDGPVP